jgi:hypothetical protein
VEFAMSLTRANGGKSSVTPKRNQQSRQVLVLASTSTTTKREHTGLLPGLSMVLRRRGWKVWVSEEVNRE